MMIRLVKGLINAARLVFLVGVIGMNLNAQSIGDEPVPLRRITLFSSGVGFFEHGGTITGSAEIVLPFNRDAINDALKSLVINDPGASAPSVYYPSEQTLYRTLRSLTIDLSGNPGIAQMLERLKGVDLEVAAPNPIRGRIIGVEYRTAGIRPGQDGDAGTEPYLSLYTPQGIRVIGLKEISTFSFKDPRINADLNQALDLIMASQHIDTRNLTLRLPGAGQRDITLSYVIPTPVWKVSYRLDLHQEKPFLQGWAIVDNDSDTPWNNVELSLVTGRPVSFIQNLYAPYHLNRPVLPLAITGIAEARTFGSGWSESGFNPEVEEKAGAESTLRVPRAMVAEKSFAVNDTLLQSRSSVAGGAMETAQGAAVGDQFEFTLNKPVNLESQQSAMLPLVEGTVLAVRSLVFSGAKAAKGGIIHPAVSAEITNTMGMKLPAGPITVYDGGTYAGDALIAFFPEQEKRLIAYGDDLSVTGAVTASSSRVMSAVTVSKGIMTVGRKQTYKTVYAFRNAGGATKRFIVEHPITKGTTLTAGQSFTERTDAVYRFSMDLPAGELTFVAQEESPLTERITLAPLTVASLVSYASNQEIPANVRAALEKAIELKQTVDATNSDLGDMDLRRTRIIAEQDRIRRNLEAAGSQTQQGQEYLKRMADMDGAIDALNAAVEEAEKAVRIAQDVYDTYVREIDYR
ncbi:MAG: DUF4139 domain-containing protein [Treponema sp.]|jgi:hypothetical protein|nr:DUF4139 domain-containing protein [Treponema sp.]